MLVVVPVWTVVERGRCQYIFIHIEIVVRMLEWLIDCLTCGASPGFGTFVSSARLLEAFCLVVNLLQANAGWSRRFPHSEEFTVPTPLG